MTPDRIDPRREYARRLESSRSESARLAKLDDLGGNARLGLFVLLGLACWLAWRGSIGWIGPGVAVSGFVAVVIWHGRVVRARRRAEGVSRHHERGLARLDGKWAGEGSSGERFADETHPYASDLDLFGVGSLFERLCAARTASGEAALAAWLLRPAAPGEVAIRQASVIELRDKLDFREDLARLGDDVRSGVVAGSLAAWGAEPHRAAPGWARVAVGLVALATAAAIVGGMFEMVPGWLVVALVASEVAIAYGLGRRSHRAIAEVEDKAVELSTLAGLLDRIERERFESPRLVELHAALGDDGRPASARIAKLSALVRWLESTHNVFFALAGAVLLWKTQFALAIEAWRAAEGASIGRWLDATGQLEAYASLAGYAFENPDDPFPEVVESGPILEGEAVGHPLLPAEACIRNDLALCRDGLRVLAVSGSNMSGKSTWLRTVGANVVLAQAGAPVRARRFRVSPLAIGGTLKVHDSLQAGRSRFYAEILRLRQLVDLAGQSPPLLFLIDEVLHGTNSADRLLGAEAVIKGLLDRGAIGLFTTHDLALAEVAGHLGPMAANVHFADHLDDQGRLAFDYRMRPGVVRQSNALALMRAVGLEV